MAKAIEKCRICGNTQLESILSLGDQYLTGIFPKTPDQKITCGPLELVKCYGEEACGLVQLRHSYDSKEMYGANYGYRSGLNQSMVSHLRSKVEGLLRKVSLSPGELVLDIGCNDGTLLSFYPDFVQRTGMDPTSEKFRQFYQPGIKAVAEFFTASAFRKNFGEQKAKIITSIAMFYDLESPLEFVKEVSQTLAEDGIWHFEQSYLPLMLATNAYDTVCHEHLEYYALKQIKWMLDRCGLQIIDVETNEVNGGSFAVTAAKTSASMPANKEAVQKLLQEEESAGLSTLRPYVEFRQRVFEHRDQLLKTLGELFAEGANVLGYGASTKGNVILQFCGITREKIPFVAEVNPDKFGSYTPGTAIPIISETEIRATKPDYFLVLPWHFRQNLLQREEEFLKRGGKMIFPLPRIEVVGWSQLL